MTPGFISGFPATPLIIQSSFFLSISAPKAEAAFRLDRVSPEIRGLCILDMPSAMVAIATARIVWDLEPGTDISPLIIDLLTSSFKVILRLI
jgi:hypothetical protein